MVREAQVCPCRKHLPDCATSVYLQYQNSFAGHLFRKTASEDDRAQEFYFSE